MTMNAKEFGLLVKERRKQMNITQAYLAALAKTGIRFISDLENGKKTIQLEKAFEVATILGLKFEVKS